MIEPGTLLFRCNICGAACETQLSTLGRETPSCLSCGSSTRRRAIIRALSLALFGKSLAVPDFPERHEISGLGMTDAEDYASRLMKKFAYRNTFYHKEPKLDIADLRISSDLIASQDFIISSDVLEHVVPPVSRAFENIRKILKPGGLFVFSVPYGLQEQTIEHFPDLHQFKLIQKNGSYRLRNVTSDGKVQEFDRLTFHGGPGSTLEMRIFAERDLLAHLDAAGLHEITVYREPDFEHGVWWPEPWSLPITARKPRRTWKI